MYRIYDDGTIEMIRGDSVEFDINVKEIVEVEGQPVEQDYDLADGDVLTFTVKKSPKDPKPLVQKNGSHISILPGDTEGIPYGRYLYDIQLTYNGGCVDTIIPPTRFIIKEEVTW